MGVNAYCCADFDRLVEKLAGLVRDARSGTSRVAGWHRPATVVVPSLDMGEYIRQTVARLDGVAVNYEFSTLQKFMTGQVEEAVTEEASDIAILGREVLKTLFLESFHAVDSLPDECAEYIQNYLEPSLELDGCDEAQEVAWETARDTRRYQLARTLATTFEEYTFSRGEMLDQWADLDSTYEIPDGCGAARWQAALWNHLIDENTQGVTRGAVTYFPLPVAFAQYRDDIAANLRDHTGPLHIFGFSGFGNSLLASLAELGECLDVHFYFSSPVPQPLDNLGDEGHRALKLWSDIGGETVEQLAKLCDEYDGEFEQLDTPSITDPASADSDVLQKLQSAIRVNADKVSPTVQENDKSLKFLNCPGIRREVEVVANDIWKRMGEAGDTIRFSDFAVVLPQSSSETYLAHVESVFGEFEQLPYTVNSMSLGSRSPVLDAVELLLELPLGEFRRRELLSLLVHPNFASRFRDVDDADWIDWTERLNILYGADREHQSRRGTYLTDDLFNWDQGMKRLALGAFMQPDDADDTGFVDIGGLRYLPEDVGVSEMNSAAALNAAVTSLLDDAKWLNQHNPPHGDGLPLEQWAQIFIAMIDSYIVPATTEQADYEADQKSIHRICTALEELAELPDIGPVSYRTAWQYATDRLSKLQVGVSQKFTGGVVVSTTQRLRALPFEHIYVLGAGAEHFPARDPRSELDVRLQNEQHGDVWPSDRDKYHFLEILQSAKSSLTLSWVGREATTGDDLPPSSVISDLKRMIDGGDELTVEHPLRRYDLEEYCFPGLPIDDNADGVATNYHPEAYQEARMCALRDAGVRADAPGRTIWTGTAFLEVQKWLDDVWHAQNSFREDDQEGDSNDEDDTSKPGWSGPSLRMLQPPGRSDDDALEELLPSTLSIAKLASFLKSPLQTKAKTVARIYDDKHDILAAEREPFKFGGLDKHILANEAFERMLQDEDAELTCEATAQDAIRKVIAEKYGPGDLPVEVFEGSESLRLGETIAQIGTNLVGSDDNNSFCGHFDIDINAAIAQVEFSKCPQKEQLESPCVQLDFAPVQGVPIHLTGKSPLFIEDGQQFLSITTSDYAETKDFLRGYISHLTLTACGDNYANCERYAIVVPAYDWSDGPTETKLKQSNLRLPALSKSEAVEELKTLVASLFHLRSEELLPIELVEFLADSENESTRTAVWQHAIDEDDGQYGGIRTQYGPVANYLDYPPPENPMEVLESRFRYHADLGPTTPEEDQ